MKTLIELVKCAERELRLRKSVYPGLIVRGKLKPETAEHELNCMEEILRNLTRQLDGQQPSLPLPEQ